MALQGLRGQGFSPVSPAPFQRLRNEKEMNAQRIMEARDARNERKKEKEKEQKEADRKLKEEFDKAKQEAVLLGMPQGQAMSMSLGAIKGWVSATREQKVNAEKMQRMMMDYEKHKADMETRAAEKTRRKNFDQGAAAALKRSPSSTKPQPVFQNVDQLTGFQKTQAQQRQAGPLRVDSVQPQGNVNGQTPPPVNVMSGMGMPASVVQGMGDNRPRPIDISDPTNPNPQNPTGVFTKTGAYHANPKLNNKPPTYQQVDPTKDLYEIDSETGARKLIQKGQTTGGVYSPQELQTMKTQYQRIMDDLSKGPPDDIPEHQRDDWQDRKVKLMTELGDTLQRAKASGQQSTVQQTANTNDPSQLFDQYFTNGRPNQTYNAEAIKSKQAKVDLIRLLVNSGAISQEQGIELLNQPPHAAPKR